MPRNIYDAAQVAVLQQQGQIVPAAEAEGIEADTGYAITAGDKAVVVLHDPFDSREAAEAELTEVRSWPEPSEQDQDEQVPWPPPD